MPYKGWRAPFNKVVIGDNFCWYNKGLYSKMSQKYDPGRICPLCNQQLIIEDEVYMVLNNSKMFPNCLIHKSCINVNFTATTFELIRSYDQFKDIISKNKAWAQVTNHDR